VARTLGTLLQQITTHLAFRLVIPEGIGPSPRSLSNDSWIFNWPKSGSRL